jgi:hypothetical protein
MRFYVKLFIAVMLFALAAYPPSRRQARELAFELRAAAVCRFGTADDLERLIDDASRARAEACGDLEGYYKAKRFDQLVAERIAATTVHRHVAPTDEQLIAIRFECARTVYGSPTKVAPSTNVD